MTTKKGSTAKTDAKESEAPVFNPTPDASIPYGSPENFGAYLARVASDERTPPALRSALLSIIVNIISNESGWDWTDDEEALAFLLPRYLFHMNELYARGIIHAVGELIDDQLPKQVEEEIRQRGGAR